MAENTIRSVLQAEHKLEHLVEESQNSSPDATEKEFRELRRVTEQAALSAVKVTDKWGKEALTKFREHTEEISL